MNSESQKTILLVEDETITAMTEKMILEKFGYKVIIANSGEDAVVTVAKTPAIDLVLMDINLGEGIDGPEAAAVILRQRDIPVVFLSSHTEPEVVAKTEKITSYGYVVKNSSSTVLDASIKMAFKLFESKIKEKEKESRMEAALEALRESEAKYRLLIENSHDIIYTLNAEGIFTFVSPAWTALLGHPLTQIVGKSFQQFVHPDDLPGCMVWLHKVIETGRRQEGIDAYRVRHADGSWRWHTSSAVPLWDKAGKVIGFEGTAHDITARKKIEGALKAAENTYRNIFLNAQTGLFRTDIKTGLILDANDSVARFIGYKDRGELLAKPFNIAERYIDHKDRERMISLLQKDGQLNNFETRFKRNDGSIIWIRMAARIVPEKGWIEGVSEDITKEKAAVAALRESEAKYRLLADHMTDTIWLMDLNFKFIYVSPSLEKLRGYTLEEIKQFSLDQILTPASIKLALEVFAVEMPKVLADPSYSPQLTIDLEFYNRDGNICSVESKLSILRDDNGNPTSILGQDRDITERKQSEAALQKSELQLKAMLNSSPVVVLLIQEGKLIYLNPAAEKITGWKEEEFIGKNFTDFVHKDDIKIVIQNNRERMGGNSFLAPYIIRINKKTGGFIYAEVNGTVINLDGKPTMLGFLTDITERKQAESQREAALQELREAKALIDAVIENVPLMIFLKEATDLRFVIFNRAGEELLGYDRKALLGKNNLDLFPPEQAAHFMAKDREVLDGEAGMLDIPEEPILTARKGTRLLHTRKVCIRGADGTTKYLLGISEDITERKQVEAEIKRQLAEKEILLKEVHHRIKNNIAAIGGLISLRLESITNPEAITVLQDAIGRVGSMRILYDKLLLTEDYKDISVKSYIESIAETVIALFPVSAKVTLDKRIADFQLDSKRLFPLGIIINELITNKMKYAFTGRDAGKIKISLTKDDKHVKLTIQDDGNGLPDGFDINESKGFGLMLVKMLSQQLGGSFSMEKHAGTRCTVEFDL
jgi:PAS domain S-box-containing protein